MPHCHMQYRTAVPVIKNEFQVGSDSVSESKKKDAQVRPQFT